jgi:hypothetical protein
MQTERMGVWVGFIRFPEDDDHEGYVPRLKIGVPGVPGVAIS